MSEDFNKILSLLMVEEKTRNFPVLNPIHGEVLEELAEINKKLAEKQKKEYEEKAKKAAEEEAADAARKKIEAKTREDEEEHTTKVNRRI